MAFQNLRSNHQVYILRKDNIPVLEKGKVITITTPIPKYSNIYSDLVLDMTVDIGGQATNFQKLPANADLADFGNNIVIATNRDAMSSEVKSMKQRSLDVINSIELHNSIINGCDEILKVLNPEIAEKQRQEEENKALREEINSLKEMFSEFVKSYKN